MAPSGVTRLEVAEMQGFSNPLIPEYRSGAEAGFRAFRD
jgi:hypothetical protein